MPFLLLMLLSLACLPDPGADWPQPPWGDSPALSAALTGIAVAATVLSAFLVARRARPAGPDGFVRESQLTRYERGRAVHHWLLIGLFAVELIGFGWGHAVGQLWRVGDRPLAFPELLVLAPFLVALLLSWAFFYDAERSDGAAEGPSPEQSGVAEAGAPFSRVPPSVFRIPYAQGRWRYVLFQARQKLALVFVPLALLLVQKELTRRLPPEAWGHWGPLLQAVGVLVMLGVFVAMPWIVRLALGLRPMPDGPLKRRLLAMARRLRFRCSELMLWHTRRAMANAMVVGLLPWPRYVIFTDRLLEEFTPEEVEAVLGHEMGHVKHKHMPFYLVFLMASITALGLGLGRWQPFAEPAGPNTAPVAAASPTEPAPSLAEFFTLHHHPYLKVVPVIAAMLGYLFIVFGFVSRRCERQADVYGCRAVSCWDPACDGHGLGVELTAAPPHVCRTGVKTFARALERVAVLNGIPRERPGFLQSWQHSTIAKRVAFLRNLAEDRTAEPAFQRRLWLLKVGLLFVLGTILSALLLA